MSKEVFITGASGFLGNELIGRFLLKDPSSYYSFLVRSDTSERKLRKNYVNHLERIRFIRGDITLPFLGLNEKDKKRLLEEVSEVWHMAASTDFGESKRESIRETNVAGTKNMVDLASQLRRLKRFFYISTAYVCGKEKKEIPEDDYENTAGYKNPYEESKHFCEKLVRQSNLPYTIIRPSIIMGDSRTKDSKGENRMYYGYLLTVYASILRSFKGAQDYIDYWTACNGETSFREIPIRLKGSGSTTKNIVTLDDVVNVCEAIRDRKENERKTYNLVNPINRTMEDTTRAIQKVLKVRGIKFHPDLSKKDLDSENRSEKSSFLFTKVYQPYFQYSEPEWRTDNTDSLDVKRVNMTYELFEEMMKAYVEKEIIREIV